MNIASTTKWKQEGELVSFDLVSNGKTALQWIAHFDERVIPVSHNATKMLCLRGFSPTPAGTVHRVRIIMGRVFERTGQRTTRNIRDMARAMQYKTPHPELALLMRDAFTDEEIQQMGADAGSGMMGLKEIVTLHEPINGRFFDIDTQAGNGGGLESAPAAPDDTWHKEHGFAFEE